ncbi:Cysteine synthase [compost metagenome]
MNGAVKKAEQILSENPDYFLAEQFKNKANVKIHRETTGPEIVEAIESIGGPLDAFIAGVGTGGTITGAGEILKSKYPNVKIYAVEPAASPILAGGKPGPHKIQGIGANFIPDILNQNVYDEIIHVENDEAFETARRVAKEEGVLSGISSGAAVFAALKVAKELGAGKKIVVVIPSNGERYLSTPLYNFEV